MISVYKLSNSIGGKMWLGVHDIALCDEVDGCREVTISRVWTHEDYTENAVANYDISIVE